MGKKQLPPELNEARGNRGKRALPKPGEYPDRAHGPPLPISLDPAAVVQWERLRQILEPRGQWDASNEVVLSCLANDLAEERKYREQIAIDGFMLKPNKEDGILRQHPLISVMGEARRRIRGWLLELGLTDSSRAKVALKPASDGAKDDPLAQYGLN